MSCGCIVFIALGSILFVNFFGLFHYFYIRILGVTLIIVL